MRDEFEGEVLLRFAHLERAVVERDGLERRLQREPEDERLRELSLAACERVLARRIGLFRCLIRLGWKPPDDVVRQLLDDEVLLCQPSGPAGG